MKTKPLIVGIAIALASAGFAATAQAPKQEAKAKPRPGAVRTNPCTACSVDVTVSATATGCTVDKADPDHLYVKRGGKRPITWKLTAPAGYHFVQGGGVLFDKPSKPPAGTFIPNSGGKPGTLILVDHYLDEKTKGQWPYTIYVTNGTNNCKLDPTVDNE